MSHKWGYYCIDCGVRGEDMINHGNGQLIEYAIAWRLIYSHNPPLPSVSLESETRASLGMSCFMEEHVGHNICIESEYGERLEIAL